jgi:HTH-type transcriptional regulator/antitoxin HigA
MPTTTKKSGNHATHESSAHVAGEIDADYLDLIRDLPLRPLRAESDHRAAQAILDRLMGRPDLTVGQVDYLAALVRFVEDYEQQRYADQFENLAPVEILKALMEAHAMNTTDLGYIIGSRGLASEVLNGKRALSKTLIAKLSRRFGISPALFLADQRD